MKKAQAVHTFVSLAILLICILVLLVVVYPSVKDLLMEEGEKGACEWSLVMHSIAKLSDWSLIPAECRAHRIEVDMQFLDRYNTQAKKRMEVYEKDQEKYAEIYAKFNNPDDPNLQKEWAINKIIATEMKDCWEKVFKGRLPLFKKWWTLYSWGSETPPKTGEQAFKIFWNIGKVNEAPVNCIVCSRIKFSDEVKNYFASRHRTNIDSTDLWLRHNYPIIGSKSYYEILTEGQSELGGLFSSRYEFSINEPLSVLYEKIYYYHGADVALTGIWHTLFGGKTGKVELNYVKLVPYTNEKIIGNTKDGGQACAFILD